MDRFRITRFARSTLLAAVAAAAVPAGAAAHQMAAQSSVPGAIRDSVYIESGSARLYLDIRGLADAPAVLLFLHGGPGNGADGLLPFAAYPGPVLERRYLAVYLFQRGVLRSPAVPDSVQTIAAHIGDVHRVVSYLHARFPRARLILIGHSWGGLLALAYAARHQEAPVDGLVLVAAGPSLAHNEAASYDSALAWATRTANDTALRELKEVGPPPHMSLAEIEAYRKWSARALPATDFQPDMTRVLAAGGYDALDTTWTPAATRIALALLPSILATDLRPDLPRLRWPLLAIAGGRDNIVLPGPMLEDLRPYGGSKRLVTFAGGDHFLFEEEPDRFAAEVSQFVRGLDRRH
jgi:proline iminopeptidase